MSVILSYEEISFIKAVEEEAPTLAQYRALRVRQFWPAYTRILQLTNSSLRSVDPSSFQVKKVFPYAKISNLQADDQNSDQIIIQFEGKSYIFKTEFRIQLLNDLFTYVFKFQQKSVPRESFPSRRIKKTGERIDCKLVIEPYGIIELNASNDKLLQEYYFSAISSIGYDKRASCIYFEWSNRFKCFYSDYLDVMSTKISMQLRRLGATSTISISSERSIASITSARLSIYRSVDTSLSFFEVNKLTRRNLRSSSRKLFVTDDFIIERDSMGLDFVSINRLIDVYSLRRSWSNPREFTIEYINNTNRVFTCTMRDTVLAALLDGAHAVGNVKVSVTSEPNDSYRLLPRSALKSHESSLTYSLLGSTSIELWFLRALYKQCRAPVSEGSLALVLAACRDFNANVTSPGLSPEMDSHIVKVCVGGLAVYLQYLLLNQTDTGMLFFQNAVVMLQSLIRLLACRGGYRALVNVTTCDVRTVFHRLLLVENEFVNYWSIEVLLLLIRCPLHPRDFQQEYVNKHTMLTGDILLALVDLMGVRLPANTEEGVLEEVTTTASASEGSADIASDPSLRKRAPTMRISADIAPNSLVIISASALLESVLSSRKDTTSPELGDQLLDMLTLSADTLMHMLRSSSSLIVENAAILVHVLLRRREAIAVSLREAALIDGLLLRHFLLGLIFNPFLWALSKFVV